VKVRSQCVSSRCGNDSFPSLAAHCSVLTTHVILLSYWIIIKYIYLIVCSSQTVLPEFFFNISPVKPDLDPRPDHRSQT
jgi:hypothetical protein